MCRKLYRIHILFVVEALTKSFKQPGLLSQLPKNDYIKIHALNLIHAAYITKQNLSTDGTTINGALELINKSKEDLKALQQEDIREEVVL